MGRRRVERLTVEQCERLNFTKDLYDEGRAPLDRTSIGTWMGHRWTAVLSQSGSSLSIGGRTYTLTPHMAYLGGIRWWIVDSLGKQVALLLIAPDGTVGSRHELTRSHRLRYASQRLWSERDKSAARKTKIMRNIGEDRDVEWCRDHPNHLPGNKPKLMRKKTWRRLRHSLLEEMSALRGDPLPA